MKEYENIYVKRIVVKCFEGAEITKVIQDACILALQEVVVVIFEHNGKEYTISPGNIVNSILDQNKTRTT